MSAAHPETASAQVGDAAPEPSSSSSPPTPSDATRPVRARPGALALPASIVVSLLASSSAPTPLYATYAARWHFSPITTTVIFGVYAIAVLLALLVFGRVSDHIGRRPVLLAAIGVQVVALVVLATAGSIDALFVGRVLQGVSTGGAIGALGAAMLDVSPARGALTNSAVPGIGTGVGSLLSGVLVEFAPAPTHLVYLVLIGVFAAQAVGVLLMAETVTRKPGVRASLVPELSVPRHLRGPVLAVAPILFAVWALAAFYGSLGPALAQQLSGSNSEVLGGLGFFLLAAMASPTTVVLDRVKPRTVMLLGTAVLVVAMAGTLIALNASSTIGLFAATAVAGIGFGAGFQGGMRTVIPLAAPHERAGVVSVLYVVCYLGMGVPSVIAGVLVVHGGGLTTTAHEYVLFVVVLAVAAALALLRATRRTAR